MSRLLVFALVFALAGETPALAGETLLESATRVAQALARAEALPGSAVETKGARAATGESYAETLTGKPSSARLRAEQSQPGLEVAGLRKRTKVLIGIGAAIGFAAVAYTIDHHVVNNTPSTLGTRKD